jgi:HK97 gp10 family phage protein
VVAALRALSPAVRDAMTEEVRKSGENVERAARAAAPADTGEYRESIISRVSEDGMRATIEADGEPGIYLEFGTRKMRERPHLYPALEAERSRFVLRSKRSVRVAIRRAKKKP